MFIHLFSKNPPSFLLKKTSHKFRYLAILCWPFLPFAGPQLSMKNPQALLKGSRKFPHGLPDHPIHRLFFLLPISSSVCGSSTRTGHHYSLQAFPVFPPGTTTNAWQPHSTKLHGVCVEAGEDRNSTALFANILYGVVTRNTSLGIYSQFSHSPGPRRESTVLSRRESY